MSIAKHLGTLALALAIVTGAWLSSADAAPTDEQVRQSIIKESIASYPADAHVPTTSRLMATLAEEEAHTAGLAVTRPSAIRRTSHRRWSSNGAERTDSDSLIGVN